MCVSDAFWALIAMQDGQETYAAPGSNAAQSSALERANLGFDCGELIGCRFGTFEWDLATRRVRGMDDASARRGAQVGRRRRTAGRLNIKGGREGQ